MSARAHSQKQVSHFDLILALLLTVLRATEIMMMMAAAAAANREAGSRRIIILSHRNAHACINDKHA